jgi:UDP-N-acetylmuramate dehydrogenase
MELTGLGKRLQGSAAGSVSFGRPLAPLTTYRLGGPAAILFEPSSPEDLAHLGTAFDDEGVSPQDAPLLVLGRGSNVVVSDQGFEGVVVRLGSQMSWIRPGDRPGRVEAGGGTTLPQLANWAARRSLTGLEFSVGIPGSVGGGIRMNAGAHGAAISDGLLSAGVFSLRDASTTTVKADSLGLGYRRSALKDGDVVVSASFDLGEDSPEAIRGRMEVYRKHRLETQPGALQNAGSTFKNPPGDAAGRLVEAAGLKNHSVGGARVSDLHANFFIAPEGTTAQDVFDLVHDVRRRVWDAFGIDLEPEVRFVGPFDDSVAKVEVAG